MILLDYKDRRPIYEQVVEKLQELMVCGALPEDGQLPSVRSLAMELSINPNTIQRAYAELERQGYIYTVKGKGSFAAGSSDMKENKKREILKKLSEVIEEAARLGISAEDLKLLIESCYQAGNKETGGEQK